MQTSGASRRENAETCLSDVIARSEATKQSTPFFTRRNGLLRYARNDGSQLNWLVPALSRDP